MRKYVDIHAHILPGVDDGSRSWEETMKMIKQAYQEGIRVLFATPHYGRWNTGYDKADVTEKLEKLRQLAAKEYPDMQFYMGNELHFDSNSVRSLQQGDASTLGGTDYTLIEFSSETDYNQMEVAVRALTFAGYHPIFAHIERYICLREQPARISKLIQMGAYMQVNARSFLGGRFDKRTAWCLKVFQQGWVHFISSDCHDTQNRAPIMDAAINKILKRASESDVKRVTEQNIVKLMKNKPF